MKCKTTNHYFARSKQLTFAKLSTPINGDAHDATTLFGTRVLHIISQHRLAPVFQICAWQRLLLDHLMTFINHRI